MTTAPASSADALFFLYTTNTSRELVALYNEAAAALGRAPVKRFSDHATAVARTVAIRQELDRSVAAPISTQPLADRVAEAIAATDAAQPAAPAPAPVAERWRRPKAAPASRIAYRPRPGSAQAEMYALLTQDGGVTPEAFAETMNRRERGKWSPKTVWGPLSYLFVAQKGYGLSFDGERIALIVPADERDQPKKGA